jgi:hypothetical protein
MGEPVGHQEGVELAGVAGVAIELEAARTFVWRSLVARSTIALTCSKLETSAPSAIAVPPA